MNTTQHIAVIAFALAALALAGFRGRGEPDICGRQFVDVTVLAAGDATPGVCDADCTLAEAADLVAQCDAPPLIRRDAALGGEARLLRLLPDGAFRVEAIDPDAQILGS